MAWLIQTSFPPTSSKYQNGLLTYCRHVLGHQHLHLHLIKTALLSSGDHMDTEGRLQRERKKIQGEKSTETGAPYSALSDTDVMCGPKSPSRAYTLYKHTLRLTAMALIARNSSEGQRKQRIHPHTPSLSMRSSARPNSTLPCIHA
jgi:hypothetical protein